MRQRKTLKPLPVDRHLKKMYRLQLRSQVQATPQEHPPAVMPGVGAALAKRMHALGKRAHPILNKPM